MKAVKTVHALFHLERRFRGSVMASLLSRALKERERETVPFHFSDRAEMPSNLLRN